MGYLWDEALELKAEGNGKYSLAQLSTAGWTNVNKSAHGGYVIGLTAKACFEELKKVSPTHSQAVTLNTAFCGSVFEGSPVEIQVEVTKKGRRYTFLRAQLKQKGVVCLDANGVFGEVSESKSGLDYVTKPFEKSTLPPYEQCKPYDQFLVELGIYPESAGRDNDFRIRRVDPAAVGEQFKKYTGKLEALGKKSGPKEVTDLSSDIMNLKLELYAGFTDNRPMDATSLIYFTDYAPPLNMSLALRPHLPNRNWFFDWTTISYSIYFLNPIPPKPLLAIRAETEIIQDSDERRCLVQNFAIDPDTGKVICVARQAALATPYPLRGTDPKM